MTNKKQTNRGIASEEIHGIFGGITKTRSEETGKWVYTLTLITDSREG
mgnify:CR=1 FL=1